MEFHGIPTLKKNCGSFWNFFEWLIDRLSIPCGHFVDIFRKKVLSGIFKFLKRRNEGMFCGLHLVPYKFEV